jgi:predicted O-methyltransferase YrrM
VLDLGLDVQNFEPRFRVPEHFREFQYENIDVPDRRRHADMVKYDGAFLEPARRLGGGMSEDESIFLHLLARAVPDGATVTSIGTWRGSSTIVLLDALRDKRIDFHFIDCFDLPGISEMSGQPPVPQAEFMRNIDSYVARGHKVHVTRANTLDMAAFPSSDFVFLDAGHTAECVAHDAPRVAGCLKPGGVAVFHDYGCGDWPDVKPEVDRVFRGVDAYKTVGVYRRSVPTRTRFEWPQ